MVHDFMLIHKIEPMCLMDIEVMPEVSVASFNGYCGEFELSGQYKQHVFK